MIEQRIDRGPPAIDEADDARRQAERGEDLEHLLRGERHAFGGLQDEAIATGDCVREEPQRDHAREIERGDCGHDAERLADHHLVDPAGDVFDVVAHRQRGHARRALDILDSAADLAACLAERLARFHRDCTRQVLELRLQALLECEQVLDALGWRRPSPSVECAGCRGDELADVLGRRERDSSQRLSGCRIHDIECVGARRRLPSPAKIVR